MLDCVDCQNDSISIPDQVPSSGQVNNISQKSGYNNSSSSSPVIIYENINFKRGVSNVDQLWLRLPGKPFEPIQLGSYVRRIGQELNSSIGKPGLVIGFETFGSRLLSAISRELVLERSKRVPTLHRNFRACRGIPMQRAYNILAAYEFLTVHLLQKKNLLKFFSDSVQYK